jgi:hypothetical protein
MQERRNGNQRPQRRHAAPARNDAASRRGQQNGSGNAHRHYERYLALAREATLRGDPIEAENCYQHAEHYFRVTRER